MLLNSREQHDGVKDAWELVLDRKERGREQDEGENDEDLFRHSSRSVLYCVRAETSFTRLFTIFVTNA